MHVAYCNSLISFWWIYHNIFKPFFLSPTFHIIGSTCRSKVSFHAFTFIIHVYTWSLIGSDATCNSTQILPSLYKVQYVHVQCYGMRLLSYSICRNSIGYNMYTNLQPCIYFCIVSKHNWTHNTSKNLFMVEIYRIWMTLLHFQDTCRLVDVGKST